MKKILPLLVFFACSSKEKIEPPLPPKVVDEKNEWVVYEGVIKTDFGEGPVELALEQGEMGAESGFKLDGQLMVDQFTVVRGRYSILHGAPNQEIIIQAHGTTSRYSKSNLKKINEQLRKYKESKEDRFKQGKFIPFESIQVDLFFKSDGAQKLILVDKDFNPIADDSRYTLYRRSKLFTAEGYISFEEARTDFVEKNTHENWKVAPLGLYNEAKKVYDSVATEEYEGIYLKALAYSVASDSSDQDLLVIKRILEIKRSDAYTDREKAARLAH